MISCCSGWCQFGQPHLTKQLCRQRQIQRWRLTQQPWAVCALAGVPGLTNADPAFFEFAVTRAAPLFPCVASYAPSHPFVDLRIRPTTQPRNMATVTSSATALAVWFNVGDDRGTTHAAKPLLAVLGPRRLTCLELKTEAPQRLPAVFLQAVQNWRSSTQCRYSSTFQAPRCRNTESAGQCCLSQSTAGASLDLP